MTARKICLWIQAALCVLVCALLSLAVIRICREGAALRAAGDLSTWVFTREKLAERIGPLLPLILGSVAFSIVLAIAGVRDENADRPIRDGETARRVLRSGAKPAKCRAVRGVRICLLIAAALLIIHGVFNGSMRDVFGKAVKICSECIGLG